MDSPAFVPRIKGEMRRLRTTALTLCLVAAAQSLRFAQGVYVPPAHVVIVGTSVAVVALGFVTPRLRRNQVLYTPEPGSLTGQVILITGGTSGLGLESAKRLAVSGATLVVTSRTHEKGKAAVDDVATYLQNQGIKNENVSYKVLQLDDLNSIRSAVESWVDIDRVDVLLLNAGVMACREREITPDGFERQIQTNHLGHFLLTALLSPRLTPNARIIAVSSAAYKLSLLSGMDFDYIWKAEKYSPWKSYSQSKLANILFVQVSAFLCEGSHRKIGNVLSTSPERATGIITLTLIASHTGASASRRAIPLELDGRRLASRHGCNRDWPAFLHRYRQLRANPSRGRKSCNEGVGVVDEPRD